MMATASDTPSPDGKMGGFHINKECDLCGNTTPVKFCQECEFTLCPACATGHQKIKATRDHPLVNITISNSSASYAKSGDSKSRPGVCVKHRKNTLEFYCEDCIVMFCTDCRQDHQDHTVQELTLNTYQNICTEHMKSLLDKTRDLEQHKTIIGGIFTSYEEAIQMVIQWEDELVKLVQESSRSLREDLEKAKKQWESVVDDDDKGLIKTTADVENKLSELHSIRKVTDVDIFSSELAASQLLLEKVNNFMKNILPTLKVPAMNDLLPNMSLLSTAKASIIDLMASSKADTSTVTNSDSAKTSTPDESALATSRSPGKKYPMPNLSSLNEKYKFDIENPDSFQGYMINHSYSNEKYLMIYGSCRNDIRYFDIRYFDIALERSTSTCDMDYLISTGIDNYVATRLEDVYLLNSKLEIVDTMTTGENNWGVSYLSDNTFLLLGAKSKNLAHLSLVKIQDGTLVVTTDTTVNVAAEMKTLTTNENKTHAFIGGNKHLYKIKLEDWTTQHLDMSQWLQKKNIWCLCAVEDHLLVGDGGGQVHKLDTQLNYQKVILEISEPVRDIAVINGYLVVTSRNNKVFLYK